MLPPGAPTQRSAITNLCNKAVGRMAAPATPPSIALNAQGVSANPGYYGQYGAGYLA